MQTHPQTPSLQDLLFYGSSNQIINLLPTPSQYFSYSPSDLLQTESPESLLQALIPRFPYDFLGQSYKSLYLPCTPAHEILLKPPFRDTIRMYLSRSNVVCPYTTYELPIPTKHHHQHRSTPCVPNKFTAPSPKATHVLKSASSFPKA